MITNKNYPHYPNREEPSTARAGRAKWSRRGFTIVELLVVIVVIAILASIAIVSYTGIQQRAANAVIVSSAKQSLQLIQLYRITTGNYPAYGVTACITFASGCQESGGPIGEDSDFTSNLSSVGTPPASVPSKGTSRNGIMYSERPGRSFNGEARTAIIYYYLNGIEQQCGLNEVADDWWTTGDMGASSTGYTAGNSGGSGKTVCVVSVPL